MLQSLQYRPLLFIIILLSLNPSPVSSNIKTHHFSDSTTAQIQGLLVKDEKTRLGSTPPSCHNKCNQCHPCMPVQASSLPRFNPSSTNKYSNYKPLGWKCRCGDHFFNP